MLKLYKKIVWIGIKGLVIIIFIIVLYNGSSVWNVLVVVGIVFGGGVGIVVVVFGCVIVMRFIKCWGV